MNKKYDILDLSRYGMLHDSYLMGVSVDRNNRILKIEFCNIYVVDDKDDEYYFPEGILRITFFGLELNDLMRIEGLHDLSVGSCTFEMGIARLTTSGGEYLFAAQGAEIHEFGFQS